jgi:RNA polymerase sigma-70 factor (ECF subfamily)
MTEDASSLPAEGDLVLKASQGDLGAFEKLIARYEKAVFNIALWKSKNYFDAEDLTQDIFLAAFRALSTLKAPDSFGGWLFGIAYNRCHKWFRRERNKVIKIQELRERAIIDAERRHRAERSSPPGTGAAGDEHLAEALGRLPQDVREALTLKYLEGMSYDEIGARLGINAHRIDYLIRKGKQMVRERLERRGGTETGKGT